MGEASRTRVAAGGQRFRGGQHNSAGGRRSFAAGRGAKANHHGAFVWQDNTGSETNILTSTASNQFLARASGGFSFFTAAAPTLTGAELPSGSTAWVVLSAHDSKSDFESIDDREILERVADLDIQKWSYKTEAEGVKHVGPFAEDFYEAFGLGHTERGISTVDADGVALAAIQGLYELVKEQQALLTGNYNWYWRRSS